MTLTAQPGRPARVGGVIFDVDGVLVASPHERAWREALADLMPTATNVPATTATHAHGSLTTAVYQEHVAGKPRLAGATALLEYLRVPHAAQRAVALAQRKQDIVDALIQRSEFKAFADGVRLALALRARRVRLGVASSSKNANRFLERVQLDSGGTLRDIFDVNVCGRDLPHGKPSPDIFLVAAQELSISPARCVVVEDATSGVQAARAAGMLALGVARLNDAGLLESAGADLVVTSLDMVDVDAMMDGHLERTRERAAVPAHGK